MPKLQDGILWVWEDTEREARQYLFDLLRGEGSRAAARMRACALCAVLEEPTGDLRPPGELTVVYWGRVGGFVVVPSGTVCCDGLLPLYFRCSLFLSRLVFIVRLLSMKLHYPTSLLVPWNPRAGHPVYIAMCKQCDNFYFLFFNLLAPRRELTAVRRSCGEHISLDVVRQVAPEMEEAVSKLHQRWSLQFNKTKRKGQSDRDTPEPDLRRTIEV